MDAGDGESDGGADGVDDEEEVVDFGLDESDEREEGRGGRGAEGVEEGGRGWGEGEVVGVEGGEVRDFEGEGVVDGMVG